MQELMNTLGTVHAFPNFNVERDIADIRTALERKDVHSLVRILTNRSNDQRQKLNTAYQNLTQKDLKAGLRKVLSGNLEFLMLSLMMPPEQFEAYRLRQAMEGLGTDEETLLEILCTRTAQQLSNITATYNKEFKRNLEKDLVSDTSGDFSRLLVALLKKECQPALLEQDVKALSEELNGKKADAWIRILTTRDPLHLRNVLIYLEAEKGQSASEIIEKHFGGIFSGDFRLGLETLVRCIENSDLYLAQRIRTMKWPVVQGVMVSHSEEDLVAVRVAYKQEAGTSLYTALQKQFTGELQYALLAICRAED
ncbi:annexin A2 [Electrophorus electricus]|uniref:annexin A2 n=1 Tax=Electrophorus electricus TaxID=8005 RepID=UPI0015D01A4B|nr:annexin A2 [Electrophorus electricus]